MPGGGSTYPNVYNEKELYNFRCIIRYTVFIHKQSI